MVVVVVVVALNAEHCRPHPQPFSLFRYLPLSDYELMLLSPPSLSPSLSQSVPSSSLMIFYSVCAVCTRVSALVRSWVKVGGCGGDVGPPSSFIFAVVRVSFSFSLCLLVFVVRAARSLCRRDGRRCFVQLMGLDQGK